MGQVARNCLTSLSERSSSCSSPHSSCEAIHWFSLNPLALRPSLMSRFCSNGRLL